MHRSTTLADRWRFYSLERNSLRSCARQWRSINSFRRASVPVRARSASPLVQVLVGVRGVVNKIEVETPKVTSEHIREQIEQALARRAARLADRIQIRVHDGTVTLGGWVESRMERNAVVGAARGTAGVEKVEDILAVESRVSL